MSIEPMRQSTNLYEQINEALKPIYLTEDEFEELSDAVSYYEQDLQEGKGNEDIDLQDVLDRLENIVLTPKEDY